jgi:hypothetical protein
MLAEKNPCKLDELLRVQVKGMARILKKYGHKTKKFHRLNVWIFKKRRSLHSIKTRVAPFNAPLGCMRRAKKRRKAERNKGNDGPDGENGPCPDEVVSKNKCPRSAATGLRAEGGTTNVLQILQ